MDFSSAVTLNLEEEVNTTGAKKTTEGRSETSLKGGTKLVVSTKKKKRESVHVKQHAVQPNIYLLTILVP